MPFVHLLVQIYGSRTATQIARRLDKASKPERVSERGEESDVYEGGEWVTIFKRRGW